MRNRVNKNEVIIVTGTFKLCRIFGLNVLCWPLGTFLFFLL